jgi:hypothetical protein
VTKEQENDLFDGGRSSPPATEPLVLATEQARRLMRSIDAARKAAARNEWRSATEQLDAATTVLDTLMGAARTWSALRERWATSLDRRHLELEADLRRECGALSWRIDGQWPALYVERAVAVRFDEKKRIAMVGAKTLSDPDAATVMGILRPLVQELLPKKFSGTDFMQSLCEAYDDVRGGSSQVAILDVYRALVLRLQKPRFWRDARRDGFVGLSLDQFRARVTRALENHDIKARDGRELRLFPPIDPADAVFIYQPAERRFGHVGRIEFKAE